MEQTAGSGDEQTAVVKMKDECSESHKFNVELSKELADVRVILVRLVMFCTVICRHEEVVSGGSAGICVYQIPDKCQLD